MDKQTRIDYILGKLPRTFKGGLNARVWVDDAGRLCVDLENLGALILNEEDHPLLEDGIIV